MPPPLDVNREAVRVLVLSIGVREAARQMGLNPDTVSAWSARGKWLEPARRPSVPLPTSMQPTAPFHASKPESIASKPAQSLENYLKRNGEVTRAHLSKAARKGATALAAGTPDKVLRHHKALQSLATVSGRVDGWGGPEEAKTPSFTLNLGIVTGGMSPGDRVVAPCDTPADDVTDSQE